MLLNSCDGNDAFWPSFSMKHRTLSLQICVRQRVRLTTEFGDWCRTCVHCTNICPRHQPLWPATWSSISLTHGQVYHKTSSTKQLIIRESDYVQAWGKITSLWTSAELKPALFRATDSLQRKTRHFASFPSQLFRSEGEVKWSEGKVKVQGKLMRASFLKVCWCCWPKIIKIGPCLSKLLQLAIFGAFFETHCRTAPEETVGVVDFIQTAKFPAAVICYLSSLQAELMLRPTITSLFGLSTCYKRRGRSD